MYLTATCICWLLKSRYEGHDPCCMRCQPSGFGYDVESPPAANMLKSVLKKVFNLVHVSVRIVYLRGSGWCRSGFGVLLSCGGAG